jgi:hypothetical protein
LSLFTKKVKCPTRSARSKWKKQVRKEKIQNKAGREGGREE